MSKRLTEKEREGGKYLSRVQWGEGFGMRPNVFYSMKEQNKDEILSSSRYLNQKLIDHGLARVLKIVE